MSFLKVLLWPLTIIYDLATRLRNYLFDIGHKPSFRFGTVVISVGNLNVGGSGKTPMVEYLVRLLGADYSVAILSRGYGRRTKGFRLATDHDNAGTLGDEPFQYFLKFGKQVAVCVGEERALAIPTILNELPSTQIILLDDAFQHRTVVPQFSILLTEFSKPFYNDFVLPFGRLREARSGARRADAIIVTKCDNSIRQEEIKGKINLYAKGKPVFFSRFVYKEAVPFLQGNVIGKRVILVSGIANATLLEAFVSTHFHLLKHFKFSDHHTHSGADIAKVHAFAHEHGADSIITTEKDMVKLISPGMLSDLQKRNWFYLPVETSFVNNGLVFDNLILQVVADTLKELEQ
jgi:tetraacyldisaccharide 4'-kinase